jgi:type III secretion system YscQ/HrcQ family protein
MRLRKLEPMAATLINRLLSSGARMVSIRRLERHVTYVELEATSEGTTCSAILPLQQLLDHWLGDTSIPAEQIDRDIADAFIRDAFQEHGLPDVFESMTWVRPKRTVTRKEVNRPFFLIQHAPVDLFLDVLPPELCARNGYEIRPDIPIRLRFDVGPLRLPADTVASMDEGDIVCLPEQHGIVTCSSMPLFLFHLSGKHIMLDAFKDRTFAEADDEPTEETRLGQLPVPISFVISQKTLTVAELSALEPGSTLSMNSTKPLVTLMIGSRRFARGELVRIGDELGVELSDVSKSLIT